MSKLREYESECMADLERAMWRAGIESPKSADLLREIARLMDAKIAVAMDNLRASSHARV